MERTSPATRTARIGLRLRPSEKRRLEQAAKQADMWLSELLRKSALRAAEHIEREGKPPVP